MNTHGRMSGAHPMLKIVVWLGLMLLLTGVVLGTYSMLIQRGVIYPTVPVLKWLQFAQSIAVFILPAWLATCLWSHQPASWLHLSSGMRWQTVCLIFLTMIVALPGINLIADLNGQMQLPESMAQLEAAMKQMEEQAQQMMEQFLQTTNIWGLMGNIVLLAILPAIGEEITFRGVCQGMLEGSAQESQSGRQKLNFRTHCAIWITAIAFSFIHFQFYGFIPRMLLGALLGYLLCWTGSLWAPILAHATNNGMAVIAYYIGEHTTINADSIENIGTGDMWWLGTISIAATIGMLWMVKRSCRKSCN
ncbi:MAG: CPBP family intramembrane metalloprotease [Paludibacteraceae bacterium]|nr:CPBP family intramembrane metalloprotease [Paludibacteraceae bacterium]